MHQARIRTYDVIEPNNAAWVLIFIKPLFLINDLDHTVMQLIQLWEMKIITGIFCKKKEMLLQMIKTPKTHFPPSWQDLLTFSILFFENSYFGSQKISFRNHQRKPVQIIPQLRNWQQCEERLMYGRHGWIVKDELIIQIWVLY